MTISERILCLHEQVKVISTDNPEIRGAATHTLLLVYRLLRETDIGDSNELDATRNKWR